MANDSNNHFFQFTIPPTSLDSPVPQPGPYLFQSPGVPDSNAVLHYVKSEMRQYHTFVATSVAVIHDGSESQQWKHVNVDMNPVDKCLLLGPEFLRKPKHTWPTQTEAFNSVCDEDPEVKKEVKAYFSSVGKLSSPLVDHF